MEAISIEAGAGKVARTVKQAALPFIAFYLTLLASFANFLAYHGYPALRLEVALITAGLLACAILFALLHVVSPRVVKALLDGLAVGLAVDFNSDATILAAVLAGLAALLRLSKGISLLKPLAIVASAVLASAALGLSEIRLPIEAVSGAHNRNARPDSVLHMILDEHVGTGGMADAALRAQLSNFYLSRGFRLLDRAYSRHFHTVNAIPDALNFGSAGTSRNVNETLDIGRTRYLDLLAKRGYRINFYQSDFANFCKYQKFDTCTTYWSPSLSFIVSANIKGAGKTRLLIYKFANLSGFLSSAAFYYNFFRTRDFAKPLGLPPFLFGQRALSSSLGGLGILDKMAEDLKKAEPGSVYFAHVLLPHYPYAVSSDCLIQPPTRWVNRRSAKTLAVRRGAYGAQVRCLTNKLDNIFKAYLASPAGKNATIIIHGDHGSRITTNEPVALNRDVLQSEDLMAGYSTLFAVRAEKIPSGIDTDPHALPQILETLSTHEFQSLEGLPRGDEQVNLDGPNWTVGPKTSIKSAWPQRN